MSILRPVHGATADVLAALREWLDAEDEPQPLVVETSGSTGEPKRVVLSRRALVASARATEQRLGGPARWVLALPVAYVAGLQVAVRSLVAGRAPVDAGGHAGLAAAVAAAGTGGEPVRVSLVPTQLHRHLEVPGDAEALARCDAVLLGGGPIDPTLRRRAEDAGVRLVATYGASETSGGCVYDGLPLDGVEVAADEDGRLRIRGPVLFDGYERDPVLTAEVLVDGWFLTSDLGEVAPDGHVRVHGRVDDVVISGGVNVPAPAVARRLREHVAVHEAEVVGVDDDVWGQRVVAFVVGELALEAARDWVAAVHPRTWAPRQLVALEALPLLGNGKVDRRRLRELA